MAEKEKTKYRIGLLAIVILVVSAVLWDVITIIPIVGDFIEWIYFVVLTYYLAKTGHGIANWKILVPELIAFGAKFIPVIQEFPETTAAVLVIIAISRFEDKSHLSIMALATGKIRAPKKVPPRIQGDTRPPGPPPVIQRSRTQELREEIEKSEETTHSEPQNVLHLDFKSNNTQAHEDHDIEDKRMAA